MSCTTSFIIIIIIIIIITIEMLETWSCLTLNFETLFPLNGLQRQMPSAVMLVHSKDILCPLEWWCYTNTLGTKKFKNIKLKNQKVFDILFCPMDSPSATCVFVADAGCKVDTINDNIIWFQFDVYIFVLPGS